MKIPKNMGNEESKHVAAVVVHQREKDIADAKLSAAKNRLKKFSELGK